MNPEKTEEEITGENPDVPETYLFLNDYIRDNFKTISLSTPINFVLTRIKFKIKDQGDNIIEFEYKRG